MISKEDFIQFAKDTHLLDFETAMGEASPMALLSPRKTRKQPQTPKKGQNKNMDENPDEKVRREGFSSLNRKDDKSPECVLASCKNMCTIPLFIAWSKGEAGEKAFQ